MIDDLRDRLSGVVGSGSVDDLYRAVEAETHHGRPGVNAATKRWIARELRRRFGKGTPELLAFSTTMTGSDSMTLRSIACLTLGDFWETCQESTFELALTLAADEDWEVREWAAGLWGQGLDEHFDREYPLALELTGHENDNIRRAMALAAMKAASRKRPERAGPLLALIERLLSDRSTYVKKNLGPFAIGSGLLRTYPEATLDALEAWSRRDDETTRWNVAMAASAAEGARHPERLLAILEGLADDERRTVRLAVRSALRHLCRRVPGPCEPTLAQLARDPATSDIAEYARR